MPERKKSHATFRNQLGRRNIPNYVRAELALKLKPVIAEKAKERQKGGQGGVLLNQNSEKANTSKELAKVAGVSHDTIHKVEKIQKEAPEETKEAPGTFPRVTLLTACYTRRFCVIF